MLLVNKIHNVQYKCGERRLICQWLQKSMRVILQVTLFIHISLLKQTLDNRTVNKQKCLLRTIVYDLKHLHAQKMILTTWTSYWKIVTFPYPMSSWEWTHLQITPFSHLIWRQVNKNTVPNNYASVKVVFLHPSMLYRSKIQICYIIDLYFKNL